MKTPTPVYDVVNVNPNHNFLVASRTGSIVSHNCSMMDEMSFKDNKELDMTKMKAYDALQTIDRRMVSRFMSKGTVPGMSF